MGLFFLAIGAGFLTVLAPCILPVLPILLGTSSGQYRHRPFFIVLGFILSFSVFGAFFATAGTFLGISNDTLRTVAAVVLVAFGLSLLFTHTYERLTAGITARLQGLGTSFARAGQGHGRIVSALMAGASLGLIWTPCAGPILGTIITLASQTKNPALTGFLFAAYAFGAGIPMLAIGYGSQRITGFLRRLGTKAVWINRAFGLITIAGALAILFGWDRSIQACLLPLYPTTLFGL